MAPSSSTIKKTGSLRQSKLSDAFSSSKRSSSLSTTEKKAKANTRRSASAQDSASTSNDGFNGTVSPPDIEMIEEEEDEGNTSSVFKTINSTPKKKSTPVQAQALSPSDKKKKPDAPVEARESLKDLVKKGVLKDQYAYARDKMGGLKPIHGEHQTQVHDVLRVFDLSYLYGPCIGVTRIERWNRAKAMGLNPPEEVRLILETQEGVDKDEYKQSVLHRYESEGTFSGGL